MGYERSGVFCKDLNRKSDIDLFVVVKAWPLSFGISRVACPADATSVQRSQGFAVGLGSPYGID